jgi:hypothetical protein
MCICRYMIIPAKNPSNLRAVSTNDAQFSVDICNNNNNCNNNKNNNNNNDDDNNVPNKKRQTYSPQDRTVIFQIIE